MFNFLLVKGLVPNICLESMKSTSEDLQEYFINQSKYFLVVASSTEFVKLRSLHCKCWPVLEHVEYCIQKKDTLYLSKCFNIINKCENVKVGLLLREQNQGTYFCFS